MAKGKALFTGELDGSPKFGWGTGQLELFKRYIAAVGKRKPGFYAIYVEEIKKTRSENQLGFYWLRNSILEGLTGYRSDELHGLFMENCSYGEAVTLSNGKHRFFRGTSEELSIGEYAKLISEQDNFVEWYNEGRPPEEWAKLPEAKKKSDRR